MERIIFINAHSITSLPLRSIEKMRKNLHYGAYSSMHRNEHNISIHMYTLEETAEDSNNHAFNDSGVHHERIDENQPDIQFLIFSYLGWYISCFLRVT